MTSIKHEEASEASSQVFCGSYARDGVEHTLVATREDDAGWRLLDVDRDTTTVIESFYPDEELEAVQAVAALYLADQHIERSLARRRSSEGARLGRRVPSWYVARERYWLLAVEVRVERSIRR